MIRKLYRDKANTEYIKYIMEQGNPIYFIWKYLRDMTDEEVADELSRVLEQDIEVIRESADE